MYLYREQLRIQVKWLFGKNCLRDHRNNGTGGLLSLFKYMDVPMSTRSKETNQIDMCVICNTDDLEQIKVIEYKASYLGSYFF